MLRQGARRIGGFSLVLMVWVLLAGAGAGETVHADGWRQEKSQHFQVFYIQDAAFAASVVEWAEHYYTQITLDLGLNHVIKRDRQPWLWDERCRIYLFPNHDAYLKATGAPAWSGGMVNYRERVVYSFVGARALVESTLPHELAHILFREYVGFDNPEVPRWLDEGVAQYAEAGRRQESLDWMQRGVAAGVYVPLEQLSRLAVNRAHGGTARVFYAQAVSLVHFLLAQYGSRRFIDFCSNLRDGYPLERALSFATSGSLQSLAELEAAWRHFMTQRS